jgi:predicted metal-dependent phosphotriesterase family hydrolase
VRLVKINDRLWVNADRVIAVEERTIDNYSKGWKTFVELTLDSVGRWQLDMPLTTVITALRRSDQ